MRRVVQTTSQWTCAEMEFTLAPSSYRYFQPLCYSPYSHILIASVVLQVPPNCEVVGRLLDGWTDRLRRANSIRQDESILEVMEHRWNAQGVRILHGQPADPPLVSDSKGILWHVSSR
jgi:hypothetical protein